MIDFLALFMAQHCNHIEVARGESGGEARVPRGRRVRTHTTLHPRYRFGTSLRSRRSGDAAIGGGVTRALGEHRRSLSVPEIEGPTFLGVGLREAAARAERGG